MRGALCGAYRNVPSTVAAPLFLVFLLPESRTTRNDEIPCRACTIVRYTGTLGELGNSTIEPQHH